MTEGDGRTVLNCGDETATEIDHEVMKLLKESYAEAKRLLSENREVLDQIADYLIKRETITGKEFMQIYREVKGLPDPGVKRQLEKNADLMEPQNEETKPQLESETAIDNVRSEALMQSEDTQQESVTTSQKELADEQSVAESDSANENTK